MSKSDRMYKIFMTAMVVVIAGLLLATGIIAIQKQMRMKVSFSATPSIFCQIDVKANGADDSTYTTIFNNNGEAIIGTGIELSGNSLLFSDTFASAYATTLGTSFVLKITNLMAENGLKVTASGTGATSNPTYVTMKESGSGEDTATMTISGNSALSTLQLSFSEYTEYAVGVSPSSGNFTYTANPVAISGENYTANIKAKTGYSLEITVTRDDDTTTTLIEGQGRDYVWNSSTGALTIYASAVTGDITINCLNNNLISYTISYNLDGGSVATENPNPTAYTVEDTFTLTNPTKTGYNFAGWTGTGLANATTTVTISQMTGNRSYTATWTVIEYTISYTLNDGTNHPSNPTKYTVESANITLQVPTRSGYSFTGWTGSNGTTAQTSVTIAKGSTGNKSYTANWVKVYSITFSLDKLKAEVGTTNVTSGYTVAQNGDVTIKLTPSAQANTTTHSASVPTIPANSCTSYTYDVTTGTLQLNGVKANMQITAEELPWIYGTYVDSGASTIGTQVSYNTVYYPAFKGYKYITFANHATQEANYYKSAAGDIGARWIVIGAGESVNSAVFNGVTRPNGVDTTTEASELDNNEILLLSEQTLISDAFDNDDGDGEPDSGYDIGNWSDDGCTLRNWLNDETTNTTHVAYNNIKGFLTTTGLLTYISYIQEKTIYTAWQGNKTADSATAESTDKVFLLATNTGYNNELGSGTTYGSAYGSQSFIMEKYLGSYTHDDASSNPKIFSFSGKHTSYWWLRSGSYDYSNIAYYVQTRGRVMRNTVIVDHGVRPSFVLNLA